MRKPAIASAALGADSLPVMQAGTPIPVVITAFSDKTFTFVSSAPGQVLVCLCLHQASPHEQPPFTAAFRQPVYISAASGRDSGKQPSPTATTAGLSISGVPPVCIIQNLLPTIGTLPFSLSPPPRC